LVHLATLLVRWWRWQPSGQARPTLKAYALGPDSPLLSWQALRESAESWLYLPGPRAQTKTARFSSWEKLGYSSALGGGTLLALTGLTLWFPETFTWLLPGWMVNVAEIVHSQGALLAVAAALAFYVPFRATESKLAELSREAAEADFLASLPPGVQLTRPPKGHPLAEAWLVLVLSVVFGATLATVELVLGAGDRDLSLTLDQVPSLVPGATDGEPDESIVPGRRVFRALDDSGKLVGWVVPGQGQGYSDKIELLVGLDPKASEVTGVFLLRHKETPGLADGLTSPEFLSQFSGVSTKQTLDARQTPTNKTTGVIKALTGATISSDAVCTIVNETVAAVKAPLAAAAE
jgi:electron transport complex protein RnfG